MLSNIGVQFYPWSINNRSLHDIGLLAEANMSSTKLELKGPSYPILHRKSPTDNRSGCAPLL
jgi:hypothetical protein